MCLVSDTNSLDPRDRPNSHWLANYTLASRSVRLLLLFSHQSRDYLVDFTSTSIVISYDGMLHYIH